ncbi:Sorbicillinoid biosynthetic cluster transcription factor 2 [Fusarium oxysporum f. sp. conglutinans]|nr:Sorbicillinoid biosynthetic cluster transcription factor 2 [Fusarium oxysporum f. sp. conglutinans]
MQAAWFQTNRPQNAVKPSSPVTAAVRERLVATAGDQSALLARGEAQEKIARMRRAHRTQTTDSRPRLAPSLEDHLLNRSGVPDLPVSSTTQSRSTLRMASATAMRIGTGNSSDALATVSIYVHDPEILYGASSTISFVERVLLTTGETDNFGEQSRTGADEVRHEIHSVEKFGSQTRQLSGLELLPIRRISDSYVDSFWEVSHPIFPILHKPTFTRFYNQLWVPTNLADTPETTDGPIMLAILNLVLAIGCRTAESVQRGSRALLSDQFYQQARGLVPIDALDAASLPAVQMLLLTAVYLQSTTYSSRYWTMVALATRMAQSLGLHLKRSASGTSNQVEREMRRRIWYTCVALERLICTTFGRPAMLPNSSSVPLPLIVDDEYLLEDGEGTQPVTLQCRIGSFIYIVRLLDILNEVLHLFYREDDQAHAATARKHEERSMPDLHELLRLNSKLDRFLEALPRNLKLQSVLVSSEAPTGNVLYQARVLYCGFLYTRLLLLRPVILSLVRPARSKEPNSTILDQNSFEGELARRMGQLCITTAHDLISVLHQDKDSVYRCSAWWTVYFTFGAAIVVLASRLCSLRDDTDALANDSLSLAMEILKHYTPEVESAAEAIQALENLRTSLSSDEKQGRIRWLRLCCSNRFSPLLVNCFLSNVNCLAGTKVSHQEIQQTLRPNRSPHLDSEVAYSPGANNFEYGAQVRAPNPLSEEWLSCQALNFDFQDYVWEHCGK